MPCRASPAPGCREWAVAARSHRGKRMRAGVTKVRGRPAGGNSWLLFPPCTAHRQLSHIHLEPDPYPSFFALRATKDTSATENREPRTPNPKPEPSGARQTAAGCPKGE